MALKPNAGPKDEPVDSAELARQITELRQDLEKLATTIGSLAQSKSEAVLEQLKQRVAELGGDAQAVAMEKLARAEAMRDVMADYVRRKPLNALAAAAAIGAVFGLLFGRR